MIWGKGRREKWFFEFPVGEGAGLELFLCLSGYLAMENHDVEDDLHAKTRQKTAIDKMVVTKDQPR